MNTVGELSSLFWAPCPQVVSAQQLSQVNWFWCDTLQISVRSLRSNQEQGLDPTKNRPAPNNVHPARAWREKFGAPVHLVCSTPPISAPSYSSYRCFWEIPELRSPVQLSLFSPSCQPFHVTLILARRGWCKSWEGMGGILAAACCCEKAVRALLRRVHRLCTELE